MKSKQSLRQFQEEVVLKLKQATTGAATKVSKLGVRIGNQNWLVDLQDISEVVPVPHLVQVPLTKPWFRGVCNVRGNLFSVTEIQSFLGDDPSNLSPNHRLLLINQQFLFNSSLLVSRILGLKNTESLPCEPINDDARPWIRAEYKDADGSLWPELDVKRLVQMPEFLLLSL